MIPAAEALAEAGSWLSRSKSGWSFTITSTEPAVLANVVAQGNGDTLGCRITINGVVKDERTVNKVDAYTFCLDKSG